MATNGWIEEEPEEIHKEDPEEDPEEDFEEDSDKEIDIGGSLTSLIPSGHR